MNWRVTRFLAGLVLVVGAVSAVVAGYYRFFTPVPALEDLNVLLISVDTLGERHLGRYNPEVKFTPNISKLADGGVRFARHYAAAPWTKPAFASIFTGLMPSVHGTTDRSSGLSYDLLTLAELFKERGFKTAGVVSHFYLGAESGYAQGFDSYKEITSKRRMHKIITSEKVSDSALKWLSNYSAAKEQNPFFMFLHYFDPHFNFMHHPDFKQTKPYNGPIQPGMDIRKLRELAPSFSAADLDYLIGLYHEEISYTDHHIGRVLDALESLNLKRKTLIVFVADHGEEFMEHGWIGHTRTLYNELIRVPLIFYLPGVFKPAVIDDPVSQVDILPTILALSKKAYAAEGLNGISLLEQILTGKSNMPERDILSEVSFHSSAIPHAYKTSVVRGNLKAIHDKTTEVWELYDLALDPGEKTNIASVKPELLEGLAAVIRKWEAKEKGVFPAINEKAPAPEELEQLKSLGYM
ncbi:MAG: sulfatase-like hydrolase/transferase [Deltaproteobacteria bacterium]|nr:sulfatase-like hydrolase/transferase [Deltaproteobacteria bacterium]